MTDRPTNAPPRSAVMPDYLKRMISAIPNAYEHGNVTRLSVRDALEEIRTGKHKQYVEHVRKTQDKESRRRIKPGGKSYAFSGTFDHVRAEGLLEHSSLICLDYDDVEDAAKVKEELREDPHVVAFFDSVSGTGLKVLVPVDPAPKDNEEQALAFEAISSRWARWGLRPDRAAKDVSRLCFTSWDPELYASEEAEPVKVNYSHERERRKSTEGRITTKETDSGIVVPDGHKYPNAQVIIGALTKIGLPEEWIRTMAHAWLNEHAETPWEAAPLDKLIADIAAKDNSLPWSTYIANLAKSQARDIDVERAGAVNLKQNGANGPKQTGNGVLAVTEKGVLETRTKLFESVSPVNETDRGYTELIADTLAAVETASELCSRPFPPIRWLVPNLVPEGLTMLSAKPKRGKSFLALNIASAVAHGGIALSKIEVEQGEVLYINVDSSDREFSKRVRMLNPDGIPKALSIAHSWPRLDEGGLECLYAWMDGHPDTKMIVLDTFKKVRQPDNAKKRMYDQDYESLNPLANLARSVHGLGIVVIHHNNKLALTEGVDPLDTVSGSTGLTAACDTIAVLEKIGEQFTLFVQGKEVPRTDVVLSSDGRSGSWVLEGDASAFAASEIQQKILDALRSGVSAGREIADITGINYNTVRVTLMRMKLSEQIETFGSGGRRYRLRERRAERWWDD